MSQEKQGTPPKQKLWVRLSLLFILFSMSFWAYNQFTLNYRNIELSNRMVEALLANETALAQKYAEELGLVKEHLTQKEIFIKKLQKEMEKLAQENEQLNITVKLLDKVSELEKTIARLKEKNAIIINQMTSIKSDPKYEIGRIKTIQDGKDLFSEYSDRIRKIKEKIKELKQEERQERINAQKERDRIESLVGNNGYLFRNGKSCAVSADPPLANKNITIDVRIVE